MVLGLPLRRGRSIGLDVAMDVARQSRESDFDRLSDDELVTLLYSAYDPVSDPAHGDRTSDFLGLLDTAVRRRIGIWRAAIGDPDELTGGIRRARKAAEDSIRSGELAGAIPAPARSAEVGASDESEFDAHLRLASLLVRLKLEHPSEILMDSDFYQALRREDETECLRFIPTLEQLAAAVLLLEGMVVEMDAGEGKTLAGAIAAAVFAVSGRNVHVLTANDYLAGRDCEFLAPLLESLGITVGLVITGMDRKDRRTQYAAQVVFTTAREVGFDFLRDCTARIPDHRVNPQFDVAIVDEADHQLIDQARTPLIISGDVVAEAMDGEDYDNIARELIDAQARRIDDMYSRTATRTRNREQLLATILLAGGLTPRLTATLEKLNVSARQLESVLSRLNDDDDGNPLEERLLYAIDAAHSSLRLTERGWNEVLELLDSPVQAFQVVQMLRARVIHTTETDYVVADDGVTLVDRLDGRPMFSHRYMHGLHEALESKEGVDGTSLSAARARTTIRALMSNYTTVSGLTGTAIEASDAFRREYGVEVVRVPPKLESCRVDLGAGLHFDRESHLRAIAIEVRCWNDLGRPILLTTGSVGESTAISNTLDRHGIQHTLLNAENPESELETVAAAGQFGAVTVSTGMTGRGTDIALADSVDSEILARAVDLAEHALGQDRQVEFHCATNGEAIALTTGLGRIEGALLETRDLETTTVTTVRLASQAPVDTERVDFGLGLLVIIVSLPGSIRVERQIRGRTGRQGRFGASKMSLYAYDPTLAFSRHQGAMARIRKPDTDSIDGLEVRRLLLRVQVEMDADNSLVANSMAEFEAMIERESRSHYTTRTGLMGSPCSPDEVGRIVDHWVERRTADLDDQRTDYKTRFAIVSDGLWHGYRIDIGNPIDTAPAEVRRDLTDEVNVRLSICRDRLGAKRFGVAMAHRLISSADELWPKRLAAMQDMTLSAVLGARSGRVAAAQLAEELVTTRAEYWSDVEDRALRPMLTGDDVADIARMRDNRIVRLPDQLAALLR